MKLRDYQEIGVNEIFRKLYESGLRRICFQLSTGGGKCLGENTPILMYDGSVKLVQDIKMGDVLMGPDSGQRKVLGTCIGKEMLYKVTPVKGDPYVVNESHILSLKITNTGGKRVSAGNREIYASGDIANINILDYLKSSNTFKHCAKGWRTGVYFNSAYCHIMPPYILGIWLSEGTSKHAHITTVDDEVICAFENYVISLGMYVVPENSNGTRTTTYKAVSEEKTRGSNKFKNKLRILGLLDNKHIPHEYKTASYNDRMELLAGLLDTDGYLHHNGYEIVTKFAALGQDILFLARSLGFAAYGRWCEKTCTNTGATGQYFRINISGDCQRIPIRIPYKRAQPRQQIKNVLMTGIKVEPIGRGNYYGFEIDGDHLFMLGDFTVTHNTVCFSAVIQRYLQQFPNKRVLVVVHRDELLTQAREKLMEFAGIGSIPIVSGIRYAPPSQVYVAMVETANNRLKQNPKWFGDVGMLIVDECHRGEHKKIYEYFPEAKIVGFTATPISSSKKDPLNNYFDDIVSTISIEKLIAQGALTPNRTYHIKNINRKALKVDSKGEFNTKMMGDAFSSGKHIQNTVDAYEKFAKGTKAIVFNCNIEHSQLVHEEFLSRGYPSRNFDSKKNKNIRPELMQWFKNTPGAILNNIDIFTTGVDETSIETIMMNRSTLSKTLWIQCGGRGSRLHPGKKFFTIIDMGGNAKAHCDWNYPHDWNYIFHNPDKPRDKDGIVPQKECEGCEALIPAQARVCPFCGYIHERTVDYDSGIPEFELVTTNAHAINVQEVISLALGHNDYHALHNIKGRIVSDARRRSDKITTEQVYSLLSAYHEKVQEWCRAKKKNFDQWHKDTTAKWFFAEINRQFGWEQPQLSLDLNLTF